MLFKAAIINIFLVIIISIIIFIIIWIIELINQMVMCMWNGYCFGSLSQLSQQCFRTQLK